MRKLAAKLKKCLLCGKEQEQGLLILEHAICSSCEQKLVAAKCEAETYQEMLTRLYPLSRLILSKA